MSLSGNRFRDRSAESSSASRIQYCGKVAKLADLPAVQRAAGREGEHRAAGELRADFRGEPAQLAEGTVFRLPDGRDRPAQPGQAGRGRAGVPPGRLALAGGRRAVPIVLAASGPQMLELAGASGDGVLVSAGASVQFVRWCLAHVVRGGDSPVTVHLDGGELTVDVDESLHVDLTGWAGPLHPGQPLAHPYA